LPKTRRDGYGVAPDRVYLHIGAPKTGTTYLQALLSANRPALRADGILYPKVFGTAHHAAAWDLRGTPAQRRDVPGIDGAWQKLVSRTNGWRGQAAVVSSELFVYCDDGQIRTALSAFDAEVHVIYTARDLIRQAPAVWQERVKNQQTIAYPDFLDAVMRAKKRSNGHAFWRAQDAAAVAERWSQGLPVQRVHVVTAPPSGSPPHVLWDRFLSVLGLRPGAFATEVTAPANRSLSALQTELLRRYNERHGAALPWPVYRRTIRTELDRSFAAVVTDSPRLTLPARHRDFFAATAADMTTALRRTGYDVAGDLDDLLAPPQEVPASLGAPAVASADEVLGAALDVLHAVLSRERNSKEQRRAERHLGSGTY
jgi:hypothetical protein